MNKKSILLEKKKTYIPPDIVVVQIEIEQSILQGGSGDRDLPNMPGIPW